MLAELLNIPKTDRDFSLFSFANYLDHAQITAALQKQKNVQITNQVIDPINFQDLPNWLNRHQQLHTAIDAALGVQAYDLQSVNLLDPRQLEGWIFNHWVEHSAWHDKLMV